MKDMLIVGLGGFFGSMTRHGIALIASRFLSDKLYLGTLSINLTGCLMIGIITGSIVKTNDQLALFLTVGFCGGYTTFSTFALDGIKLMNANMNMDLIIYILVSAIGGLALCILGYYLSHKL